MDYVESLVAHVARQMVGGNADAAEKVTRGGIEALQEGPVAFGLFLDAVKGDDGASAKRVGREIHGILQQLGLAPQPQHANQRQNQQRRQRQHRGGGQNPAEPDIDFEYFRRVASSLQGEQSAQTVMRVAWAVEVIECALSYARYYAKGRSQQNSGARQGNRATGNTETAPE